MSTLLGSKLKQKLPSPKKQQYKELMILQKNEVTVGKNSSTSYLFDDKGIMKSETKVTSQKRVLKESPTTPLPLWYKEYSLFHPCHGDCQKQKQQIKKKVCII